MAVHTAAHHSRGQLLPFRESLLAMLGISFVTMLVAFDQTVVGTALPTIVAELKGFELYAWVATSYLLTSVITVPIFGRQATTTGESRSFWYRSPFSPAHRRYAGRPTACCFSCSPGGCRASAAVCSSAPRSPALPISF